MLSRKGAKALRKAGSALLATVEATTNAPAGSSTDSATVFVHG